MFGLLVDGGSSSAGLAGESLWPGLVAALCVQQLTLDKTRNRREASEAFEVCVCVCARVWMGMGRGNMHRLLS